MMFFFIFLIVNLIFLKKIIVFFKKGKMWCFICVLEIVYVKLLIVFNLMYKVGVFKFYKVFFEDYILIEFLIVFIW